MSGFEKIRLEKGMYAAKGGFTAALEALDPSENYKGTALEGLDAYQRQLKRFDIKVAGPASDRVEKFFSTADSAALFPEYVSRAVRQGMEEANILPKIVATVTDIDALDYRTITSVPSEDDKELKMVAEGSFIPETTIKTKENLVRLKKRGRMLVASYEAIRFQRIDLFTVTLKQIGAQIARSQVNDALAAIVLGDGNDNPAEIIRKSEGNELTYEDLVDFWSRFDPYQLNTLLVSCETMRKILSMKEFKDSAAGLSFHATGKMVTPLGAELIKVPNLEEDFLIGIDRNCALEMVRAGGVVTEYDKLIDRQLERAAITCTTGFSKIFDDACKVFVFGE